MTQVQSQQTISYTLISFFPSRRSNNASPGPDSSFLGLVMEGPTDIPLPPDAMDFENIDPKAKCEELRKCKAAISATKKKIQQLHILMNLSTDCPEMKTLAVLDKDLQEHLDGLNKRRKFAQLTRFRTKEPLPLFQVTLPNIEINKQIWNLTSLLFLKIKVEKFIRKTGPIQCFNCNYWHHSAASCHMKPRCLKCGKEHNKAQCESPPEITTCINCGKGHSASYRGCEKFPKSPRNNISNRYKTVNPNLTYASMVNKEPYQVELPPPEKMSTVDLENNVQAEVHFPVHNITELEGIKYILNEFRRLFGGHDIMRLSTQLQMHTRCGQGWPYSSTR
ncbi:Nucleic-acid-binding protein transposon like protein [Argiope bruennichi]|uniref:Nucleic-acid-binding protein transposon like protein n=1 Tax=Argiope bruennichi TaxID=94029 RepID=A0A8T0ET08_ARGBR|nr:Nucleic-acid-binding protein transposon like protein [Argiope bruennichi]